MAISFGQYLRGIGVTNPRDYFNSDVLAARRTRWIEIGDAALRYIRRNSKKCVFHDQSALNAVSIGRREVLWPKYNFVSWYADIGAADMIKPALIHFTGGSKPWFSKTAPWFGQFKVSYDDLLAEHPLLRKFWKYATPLFFAVSAGSSSSFMTSPSAHGCWDSGRRWRAQRPPPRFDRRRRSPAAVMEVAKVQRRHDTDGT